MIKKDIHENPERALYYCSFGDLLQDQGEFSEAMSYYQRALAINPDLYEAYHNLGNAFFKQNRYRQAILCHRKALEKNPNCADAYNSIGNSYYEQGRLDDACLAYQKALQLNPKLAEAYFNLGNLNQVQKRYSAAITNYQKALEFNPNILEALINLGNSFCAVDKYEDARGCYRKILEIDPSHSDACNNIGNAYYNQGKFDEAFGWYQKALKLNPELAEAHFNLSLLYLQNGQFDVGWKHYNWRFKRDDWQRFYPVRYDKPLWQGASFKGSRLLVHAEQGLGDTLQCVRYLPMVKKRGGTVIFEADPSLIRLLKDFPGVDELVPRLAGGKPDGEFDYYVPLQSLPGIFKTNLANIPNHGPYLFSDPDRTKTWKSRMLDGGFQVGLVWSAKSTEAKRSCELKHFAPILKIPGIQFYGMQKGAGVSQTRELSNELDLINLGERFEDFADTAAVIANLDLVISVDTSVVHLAGAMGKPVWTLLPFVGDWRWLSNREDSPWYPTVRLFRQTKQGNWDAICERMASELSSVVNAQKTVNVISTGCESSETEPKSLLQPLLKNRESSSVQYELSKLDCAHDITKAGEYHQAGQFDAAKVIYRQILERHPDHPDVLHLLGVLHHQSGNNELAVQMIEKAIHINSSNPFYHCNLGVVYRSLEELDRSVACYQKSLAIKPDYADAFNNMANIFRKQGRLSEAADLYRKAIALQPDDAVAYNNLGHVYRELGSVEDEITCYDKALRADPDDAQTYLNLGNALQYQGELDRAITCYEKALEKRSDFPEAYNNLGSALITKGQLSEAARCHQKALLINPYYAEAYNNLGSIHQNQGEFTKGIFYYRQAIKIKPDYVKAHSNLLYCMHYDPTVGANEHFEEASYWWQRHGLKIKENSHSKAHRVQAKRIKIGYVSPDFREHSVSYFFLPFLKYQDHKSFEVFCYSEVKREDKFTQKIKGLSDHWRSIVWLTDDSVAEQIKKDGIDILVDLAGHTAGHRLPVFARRPAPVQITWLGYPDTTGMPVMDYRLTDDIADPVGEADKYHSETLIRLSGGFLCYRPPDDAPSVSELPALKTSGITFGSFNNLPKINAATIGLWSRLIQQVPDSSLLLKSRQFADDYVRQRFLGLFSANGVAPERIRLLPRTPSTAGHLALYHEVDIGLDPFPYNGTTTTCEALWMGVPVITLRGNRHAGRVGASLLTHMGLTEMIAESEDQYVRIGTDIAEDIDRLQQLRAQLRTRMQTSALCDGRVFAQAMEKTFRILWERQFEAAHYQASA